MNQNIMGNHAKVNKRNFAKIIPLVLIGVGLIILGLILTKFISTENLSASNNSVTPSEVNFSAPNLVLNDLNGQKVEISGYQPDIVLINNWATWCPPCRAEMPTLAKFYKQHKDEGFILVGINAGDPSEDVAAFVEEYGLTFPVLLDPNNKSLIAFHNDGLPSSYVIDRNGDVVLAWTGPVNGEMLEKYVTPLLEQ